MLGCTLGHYHIVEPIGAGGMGVAYLARDERLNRKVVLKVLPPEVGTDQTARARLVREAQMASALNHPYICTIYEVGEENGFVFIAMEHIEGRTLASSHSPMGPQEVLRYGCQIAEALEHAHRRGIIHRDLKGTNVMLTSEGRVKVLDFGLRSDSVLVSLQKIPLPKHSSTRTRLRVPWPIWRRKSCAVTPPTNARISGRWA